MAAIGVAEGDFYPRITLSGNIGLQALQLGKLDTDRAGIFGVGPACRCRFEGGRLRGRLRLREAQAQRQRWHSRKPCSAPGTMSTTP